MLSITRNSEGNNQEKPDVWSGKNPRRGWIKDPLSVWRHQPNADGETHQARDVVNAQPLHDLRAVCLDRLDAEV